MAPELELETAKAGAQPQPLRLFIAIPVPDNLKEELRRVQALLRQQLPDDAIRWTRPEQVHLTLNFLGDVPAHQVAPLTDAVRVACASFQPLHLRAGQLDFFPHARRPRVLWAGVQDHTGQLPPLARHIIRSTAPFCMRRKNQSPAEFNAAIDKIVTGDQTIPPLPLGEGRGEGQAHSNDERHDFTAHLTLARLRTLRPAQARRLATLTRDLSQLSFPDWPADRIEIIQSQLSPNGSQYKTLASIQLLA